ncbi:MAG: NAD(P)/FAD-dependent oxidoreductase [Promethearchaeota archaeon]|nr:MAG: NAD(P)/FAD-dependent oxidoreductase [Candidatus Lokiarchaeota archaeon]
MPVDYDVIMIGTGIGGSACAALLAHAGFKVLILEKNKLVGGMSSSYEKEGFIIDSAIHVFSSGIQGRFGKILKKVECPDLLKFVPITDRTALRALGQKGYTRLAFNPASLQSEKKDTPNFKNQEQVDLSKMGFRGNDMKTLMTIMGSILQTGKRKLKAMHEEKLTFEKYLEQYSPTSGVKSLLAFLTGGMFGLPPRTASAPELIQGLQEWVITNDLSYPLGGAIAVPQAFLTAAQKYGGEVRTNAKVSKIIVENGEAKGVILDGEPIYSKIVVSNAGIKPTVNSLVGNEHFDNEYIEKVENLVPSYSAITFKFALKEPIIDHYVFVNLYHGDLSVFGEKERTPGGPKATGFMTMIPSNADPNLAPPGHQLVIFGTLAPTHSMDWDAFLDHYYQDILKFYPEIEDKMLFKDITTPLALAQMSGKAFGPIETTALIPGQAGSYRISSELPIENLFVVGDTAGTDTHGIGTQLAADSGMKGAKLIIEKYKRILA